MCSPSPPSISTPPTATAPTPRHAILLGQDKRELGALVVTDEDALAADGHLSPGADADARLQALLEQELAAALAAARPDARPEEHVAKLVVVRAPLSPEDGTLTRTMKPRRGEVVKREAAAVARLMGQLRG